MPWCLHVVACGLTYSVYIHAAWNLTPHVFPYHFPAYILSQGLSVTRSLLIQPDWLASVPQVSSSAGIIGIWNNIGLFHRLLAIKLSSSYLINKHFLDWAISLTTYHILYLIFRSLMIQIQCKYCVNSKYLLYCTV